MYTVIHQNGRHSRGLADPDLDAAKIAAGANNARSWEAILRYAVRPSSPPSSARRGSYPRTSYRQVGERRGGNIRRVGNDHVELLGERADPNRRPKNEHAIAKTERMRHCAVPSPTAPSERSTPKPTRGRQLRQQRQQQAARPGAEIEHRQRAAPIGTRASTASTMVSLSGLGSSVSGDKAKSRPQNSRRPNSPA